MQTALAKTWRHHDRVAVHGLFEAYVRRTMVTTFLSWRGRRWHAEVPTAPEATPDGVADPRDVETSVDVARALAALSPRQRAVVVSRYFDDLTEVETARTLGLSVASVKTHHRRALHALRASGGLSPDIRAHQEQEPS